jgi:Na+/glutamate symporter
MFEILVSWWGCVGGVENDTSLFGYLDGCSKNFDMSNTGSAWFGLIGGLLIGGLISLWIYNRQKKTSDKQDKVLKNIEKLEKKHEDILHKILALDKKIDSILEKK